MCHVLNNALLLVLAWWCGWGSNFVLQHYIYILLFRFHISRFPIQGHSTNLLFLA